MTMFGSPPVPDWLQQQPQPMQPNVAPSMMQTGQVKQNRGGMFGSGLNAGEVIVNLLNGALAGAGNPVGIANIKMMQDAYREKQQRAQEEAQYQRQRSDGREDFLWKQEHTPQEPTQTDRYLGEYLDPNTPQQRRAALGQILFPPVMSTVNGMPAIIDRAQMVSGASGPQASPPPQAIQELKANPTSAGQFDEIFGQGAAARILGSGGPVQQAPGGFPRSY